ALSFDPISSQGLFNALYTGLRGAEALAARLAGDGGLLAAYCARLESVRKAYRHHFQVYYGQERRWAGRPFWAARCRAGGKSRGEESGRRKTTVGRRIIQ
ncbi:MAG: hypothetical protein AAFY88_07375, partial [Acidobacteriota bacterium]